jgi:hypothetical protein
MEDDEKRQVGKVVDYFILLFRDSSVEKTTNNFIKDLGRGRRIILRWMLKKE